MISRGTWWGWALRFVPICRPDRLLLMPTPYRSLTVTYRAPGITYRGFEASGPPGTLVADPLWTVAAAARPRRWTVALRRSRR